MRSRAQIADSSDRSRLNMVTRRIVFIAVPPIQLLDVVGPYEVFAYANQLLDARPSAAYGLEVISTQRDPFIAATCGLPLLAQGFYRDHAGPSDTLLIVGGDGARRPVEPHVLAWLQEQTTMARRIGSVCTGAFVLAAVGLLDGRRAVTHWNYCDLLAQRYPAVRVEMEPIYTRDGNIYTSAGVTAGIDLALALVEEDHGIDLALQIAQKLVMFLRRSGGQRQFSEVLARQGRMRRPLGDLQGWILTHLADRLDIATLAEQVAMSQRHFARIFVEEFGTTPARFVECVRVDEARRSLTGSAMSIEVIARACGFGTSTTMRRAFLRVLHVTPQQYRMHFSHQDENPVNRTNSP